MPSPLRSFFIGALEQQNQQRKENSALMKELFLAKQKAQMANLDTGEILNQIQLKNIVSQINRIYEQGGQQGGQPYGTPGQQPSFLNRQNIVPGQIPQAQLGGTQQYGAPGQQQQSLDQGQQQSLTNQQQRQSIANLERPEINEDLPPPTITRFEKDPKFGGL